MVNPLDRDETSGRRQRTGLRALEDIAIESGVPANLLVAIGEHAPDSESAVRMARELAAEYAPRIRAGEDIQAILRAEAPDHAEAIIGRARQIGEQLYPDQMRSAREAAERAAQERRANEPGIVGDFGRSVGAGVVEGLGSAVEGAGVLLDQPLSLIRGDETYQPGMLARAGAAVGDAARGVGEGLREGMSEDSRRAMADSTPDGNLFDPSTYSMGEDPSPRGYLMHFGSVLGSLLPVIATGVAGRVSGLGRRGVIAAGGAVGGAQTAGDGAETARSIIEEAYQRRGEDGRSELEVASPEFRALVAQGRSEEEAFAAVRDEAMRFGALMSAPIGAASGAFMGLAARGLNPVINRLPGGPMSRALQAGLATAFEEGASEAAEGMAARYGAQVGSGMDVDETQETFGNFVLGALGGGPVGAVSGLASPRTGGRDDEETQETGQGLVSPQPAAPGGASQGAERTPADLPNFNATGRDEQGPARGELVRVQIRGERGAWDGEIIGESEEGIEVRSRTGETLLFPRADLDSGDVILTRAGRSTSTPAARRGAPDLGLGLEPEAEAAGEARPLTADDARRFLDAIEARARRVGWDDDMRATAAQLKDAIDRGTPIPASIAENPALVITKRDGAPFGDEASARRALGKLGVSVGGYDIVPVEGGYVARPKLDIRNEPMAGGGGTGPLGIDDGGRSRRAQLGVEPDVRDGRANSGQQPAVAQDRGGVPDAVARGEPDAALNVQQDVQPAPPVQPIDVSETPPGDRQPDLVSTGATQTAPVIENIRAKAAVLRGIPKDKPPVVEGVSLKWDEREGGFIFPRALSDKVQEAIAPVGQPSVEQTAQPSVDQPASKRPATNEPRNFEFIDAAGVQKIGTEPGVMQYKAGGDADGVTDRLRGITEWRPERAGVAIIYEYADGRRVIADGHQRLGLAKRLAGEGKPIQMLAMILRQADGVTPEQARVTAALKNIAEGSGTALDAAKVLRGSTETVQSMALPPSSAIVRDALGMRDLSDKAFGMVVNGLASERDGGIVGRVVTNKDAQANILAMLARLQKDRPISAFQAESVARQAAADTVEETQDSLFGPETDTQNLYLERAKILEAAIKMVREDERTFKNVVANADRLQAAGNQLDADGNKAVVDKATTLRDYLQREANTKGPISDALSAAARAHKGGATLAAATRQFLDAAERVAAGGLVAGQRPEGGSGRSGGDSGGQPAGSDRPQEPGAQAQGVTPPAEPDQDRDDAAAIGDMFGGSAAPASPAPDPKADIVAAMTGQKPREPETKPTPQAEPSRAQFIDAINLIVKPDNKDGDIDYTADKGFASIYADGDNTTIHVTIFRKVKVRGQWATEEKSKRLRYSDVREDLTPEARAAVEAVIAADADPAPQADPEPTPAAPADWLDTGSTGKTPEQVRAEAEVKVRADQSKMRRLGGNGGAAGPLFDDGPADLFAEPKSPAKPDGSPIAAAAQETDPTPTPAQAEAENYRTGKADWNGLTLSIENAKGSTRRGTSPDGTEWSVKMPAHYGRILGTKGADGDHVDFYMGDMESSDFVVIVNQINPDTGAFDEHKVMLGTGSRAEALRIYQAGFSDGRGRERIGSDTATTVAGFKAWLESGDMTKPTQPVKVRQASQVVAQIADVRDAFKLIGASIRVSKDGEITTPDPRALGGGSMRVGYDTDFRIQPDGSMRVVNEDPVAERAVKTWNEQREGSAQKDAAEGDAFPTTLEDITAAERRQRAGERLSHIYAEYRGQRFYLASVAGNPDAPASEWRKTFPGVSIYTTDRADGTSINGDSAALEVAIAARDGAKKGGEDQLTPPSQTAPKAKIEDFGEKIGGAKKDVWSGYAQKMAEAENFDLAKDPLSKTWPEPDYEALVRDGVDAWSVGFVRAARDAIPRKPSSSWKVKQWVEQVRLLRGLARQVLSGDHSRETIEGKMVGSVSLQRMQNTIALYETFGHAKSLKGLTFRAAQYSVYGGVRYPQAKVIWEVTKEQKATAFSNMPRVLASGDTREQAIEAFRPVHAAMTAEGDTKDQAKADKRAKFVIWTQRTDSPKTYYVGVKIGTNHVALRSGIADVAEARRIVAEEADQLQAQLDKMRDIPSERRDTNEPRVGSDHRGGVDVTPAMFADAFGFRGVEFGNYVEDKRRQEDLNNAYDALMDLAGIIGVPSKALSLNGTLGLAFGARGSGGKNAHAAHFEPGKIVINLTKTRGRGSLAHEWFHALDNYFARMREPMRGNFITDNASAAKTAGGLPVIVGIRPEVIDAFLSVRSAINKTNLPQRSRRLDTMRTSPYYGTGIEMHARAFESYVVAKLQDQGGANDYLANLVGEDFWEALSAMSGRPAETYPYLRPDEIEAVRPAFDALFRTIETKQTEGGVAMYSRRKTPLYSATLRAAEGLTMTKGTGPQFLSMLTNTPGVKPEELDWIGLRDFLRGKDRVTRDEVVAFIRENQVQVVEHRKGGATDPDEVRPSEAVQARYKAEWDAISAKISEARDALENTELEDANRYEDLKILIQEYEGERDELHGRMVWETIEEMGGLQDETKFEDWRTPGGQQYRELLLAMQSNAPRFGVFQGERMVLPREYATAAEAREAARQMGFEGRATVRELDGKNRNADTFKSSHWSEPNVLAHIRFDERAVQVPLTDEQRRQNERRAQLQAEFDRLTWEIGEAVRQTVAERKPIEDRIKAEVRADMLAGKVRPGDYMQEVINRTYDLPPTPGMIRQRELGEQRAALGLPSEAKPTSERTLFIQEIQSDWHQAGRKKGYRGKIDTTGWTVRPIARESGDFSQQPFVVDAVGEVVKDFASVGIYDATGAKIAEHHGDYLDDEALIDRTAQKLHRRNAVPDAPLKRTWHETAFRRAVAWAVEHGYDSVTWATGEMNAELFDLSQQISSLEWTWHPDTKEVEVQAETPGGEPLSMWRDQETLDEAVGKEMANRIISEINAGKTTDTYRGLDLKVGGEGMHGFYDKIIPNYAAKWGKRFGASVGRVMIPVNDPGRGVRQITAPAWHMPITDSMRATVQMEGVALFKRGEAPAEVVSAKAEAVKADLERAWHRLGLPDSVRLRLIDQVFGMDPDGNTVPVDGSYVAGLVRVALDSSEGALATMHHEVIHALRDPVMWGQPYGLFSEVEWSALEAEAGRSWLAKHRIAETYPDLTPAEQIEEAIAAEFAAMSRAGSEPETAPLRRALRKVLAFFKAFGRALRGAGVQDADGVFGKVMSGEVGRRGGAAERNTDGTFASHAVKYSRRVLAGDGPVTAQAERGVVGQMLTDAMGGKSSRYSILALVPGEPLYQELAKNIASARTYLSLKHAMSAMRNKMQAEAAKTMDEWRGFMVRNRKSNDALMDLMHDATKAGLDPAAPFSVRKRQARETQAEYDVFVEGRRVEYAALKARWDALPAKAQGIYRKVRDSYVEVAKTEREIIEQNIKDAMDINLKRARQAYEDELTRIDEDGLEGDERMAAEEAAAETYSAVKRRDGYGRASRLRSLRLMLEGNQVDAPYFPLLRHGQYFVTVKDKNGKIVSFTKAESEREQARIASAARAEFGPDHDITTGLMGAQDAAPDVDPMFVADVEELIGSKVDDPALMDAIWQRYLETLPDFSMRKSRLHRKGTPGYSRDAFRAFARQMFHSAHQLARLKHGMKMQMALDDAKREAQSAEDPNRAMAVVNEMGLRHDWIMNPKSAAWSTWATSAAFVYYLGMTPAAALVNLSQTVVVGIPVLAAGFKNGGALRASRQLMRALKEFGTGLGAVEKAKTLTDDERAAIRDAYDRGIVDKSQAHDLAGAAEAGVEYSDIRQRIMAPISFFFHHAERLNREITFLAAYRMARADGMAHPEAIDKAGALTWKTHFNYESDSRPRVQQNDFMRVATVFRNFQLNMLYRLFRDIHQTFKGRTAEDRQEARAQLFGITGIMALSAGVTGTWGYSLLMTLAGMFAPGADADDLEKEIKNALVNTLGQDLAGIILHGVPGHLTGINLTSRIGMPELWFRSPDRQMEGDDLYNYWAQQFLGAVPGMAQNIFRGVDLAAGGDIWRGMETASPKFIRDLMRGVRYSQDGVTTISGNTILESVPPMDALVQALGFTPAQISERYDQNRWMMNENVQIQNARSAALTSVWRDVRDGGEISERTRAQIEAFNADNPDYAIDAATIRRSVQSRRRGAEDTVGGIRLNNRIEGRIRANAPVSIYGAAP